MSLTQALLGLLAVEPATGYELTKEFEGDLGRWAWQAGHTSIYPELIRMTERGLVEVIHQGARRSRTYAVTEKGREELRQWLRQPPGQGVVRNEGILRLFLLEVLEPDEAMAILRQIIEFTSSNASDLRRLRERRAEEPAQGRDTLGQLAAEYGLRQYEAMHDWALWALEQLNKQRAAD
jgi:DNA-binding PadR family transcriptional regulator